MTYAQAVDRLNTLAGELAGGPARPRRKFRLEEMQALAAALGRPQDGFRSVLVAGTNGKGSVSATLASILAAAGCRAGLYTSPHLERVNERIRVDGEPVGDHDFARLLEEVWAAAAALVSAGTLPAMPSYFETLTAMAFRHFASSGVELAVLEVGMGGRLDATNVVEPLLSVITDISLDHTEWLGDTIAAIAREKAGILRPGGVMVTLPQHPEANAELGQAAVRLGVEGVNAAACMPAREAGAYGAYPVTLGGETILVNSPLEGRHQHRNLALAMAAALELRNRYGYNLTAAHIAQGIAATRWPGRLEALHSAGHGFLLDVAHNPAGAWALRSALSGRAEPPGTLVFGCLADKAVEEMASILFPLFGRVLLVEVDSPRTAPLSRLAAAAEKTGTEARALPSLDAALEAAMATSGLTVISGSVFLVGAARARLRPERHPEEEPVATA
jgi:dihydrofolate synthase/folylpolyglutamate synthase